MGLDVREENYEMGEVIFSQDEENNGVFIIQSGEVAVVKKKDKKISLIGIVKAKEFLGGASLFSDDLRSAHAVCLNKVTCLKISKDQIKSFIESKPFWVKDLFHLLVEKLNQSSDLMISNNIEKDLNFEEYGLEASWVKSKIKDS